MRPLISVITVVYNGEKEIEETMDSVLSQTFKNFEYIILDGKSSDRTVEVVKNKIATKMLPIECKIISEKDSGIYNAMNKAINYTSGEWVIYLNAGDQFAAENVLEQVASSITAKLDVIYGDAYYFAREGAFRVNGQNIEMIKKKMPFCHQAVFVKRDLVKKYSFNEKIKVCADYDLFCRMYVDGCQFCHISSLICNYSLDGFSGKNIKIFLSENISIRNKYGFIKHPKALFFLVYTRTLITASIKSIVPPKVLLKVRTKKYEDV